MMRILCATILCLGFFVPHIGAQEMSVLEGVILGKLSPLSGANVTVIVGDDTLSAITNDVGEYRVDRILPGKHRVEASHVAYQKLSESDLVFVGGQTHRWDVRLVPRSLSLDEIVVNPGSFSVMEDDPIAPRGLSRAEIKAIPAVTDDIFRTVERLPGVSGGDFLARFTVRGGDYDQVLVTLDGLELFEPFHLKDLGGGVLSIIDAEVVGGLDMMTGGFSADFGNRQSAVLQMRSRRPEEGMRASFSAGIMNARLLADGANEKWGFLVSARQGYADIMVEKIDPERDFNPEYYDIFGKVTYNGDNHQLGAQVLWASDTGGFTQVDGDHLESAYGNGYTWLTWDAMLGSGLVIRTLPYYGRITSDREATLFNAEDSSDELVDDIRTTSLYGVKSDAKWQWHEKHITRFGGELRWLKSDYDYRRQDSRLTDLVGAGRFGVTYDDVAIGVTPEGWQNSFYLSHKWRLHDKLTADIGGRFDRQTYTSDEVWSPRAGLA
ncbi:MAG: TonB-dependent receptor, partial [Candidatus Latescibacteria bacterium]|nr:TonB-dependent receptor [Candidatus Latescibacterota bacterium]